MSSSEITMSNGSVLEINDLHVSFSTNEGTVQAVQGVCLTLHAGETLALVGETGSGKSTAASAINRLLSENARIDSGQIIFRGNDITNYSSRQLHMIRGVGIGLVPQDPMSNLDPVMTIGDQIAEALEAHNRIRGNNVSVRVKELLTMVGITDPERRMRQYPHEFSGGMRQRVLIAIGLACGPTLLIADEPTSALDVTIQRQILDELETLTSQLGTAVLLITHDLAIASDRADRIAVMYRGKIVEQGDTKQILNHPQHPYTKRLLGAIPSFHDENKAHTDIDPDDVILRVTHLAKVFRVKPQHGWRPTDFTAVDDINFEIPRCATVSLVGESGSGKSTVANMILGLEQPTRGRIEFAGAVMDHTTDMKAFRRHVQPVFQNPFASLDPRYSVERSISEPMRVHKWGSPTQQQARVSELLERVALPNALRTRLPHELSGGQRQRVAIARALALKPDLVILDEAVSALDVLVQEQILELLGQLQRELGLSYLFISHDLAVVRMISNQVHVMRKGLIVESGTPQEIFDNPHHPYTQELLTAIPGQRS